MGDQPLQPGQRIQVRRPGETARPGTVVEVGEPADAVTVDMPGVEGGIKRDIVFVRYDDGEVDRVRHDHIDVDEESPGLRPGPGVPSDP